jgi:hypothetical protein
MGHLVDPSAHLSLSWDSEQHTEDEEPDDAQEHQRKEHPSGITRL